MANNLFTKIEMLHKKHRVDFHGMYLPIEKCVKNSEIAEFTELDADGVWEGFDYIERIGLFFLNIRSLESILIYCVSECVLRSGSKCSIDYRDIASALGLTKNKKIDFQFGTLLRFLKDKGNLREDFFNELEKSVKSLQEIRNILFHANTTHSLHAHIYNKKLYFNTSPIIDDTGIYAYVYEVNEDFFEKVNEYIREVRFELLEITYNIKPKRSK